LDARLVHVLPRLPETQVKQGPLTSFEHTFILSFRS
jgi:hypothetical protein